MIKHTLLATVVLLSMQVNFAMDWALVKAQETPQEKQIRDDKSFKALINVWQKKEKSTYFCAAKMQEFSAKPKTKTINQAIQQQNLAQCILHIVHGTSLRSTSKKTKATLLHLSVQSGFYPFCKFLLTISKEENRQFKHPRIWGTSLSFEELMKENSQRDTPLHIAAREGHHAIAALILTHYEIDDPKKLLNIMNKLGNETPNANLHAIYKQLASYNPPYLLFYAVRTLDNDQFHEKFPLLWKLGARPLQQDANGRTVVHELLNDTLNSCDTKLKHCLTLVRCYQRFLEQQALLTMLAIHTHRKDSLISKLPKDIIKYIFAPMIRLFPERKLEETVNAQLSCLKHFLSIKDNNGHMPYQLLEKQKDHSSYIVCFNPDNVESNRAKLTQSLSELWGIPSKEAIKSKL